MITKCRIGVCVRTPAAWAANAAGSSDALRAREDESVGAELQAAAISGKLTKDRPWIERMRGLLGEGHFY
jgi:hypothetical protein